MDPEGNAHLHAILAKLQQQLGPEALERVQEHLSSISAHLMLKQDYPGDLKKTLFINKALQNFFAYLESEIVVEQQIKAQAHDDAIRF